MTVLFRCAVLLVAAALASCSGRQADPGWVSPARQILDPDSGVAYQKELVFVPSGPHLIASTLLRPEGSGPVPAMVVVSGSQDGILTAESPLNRRLVTGGIAVLVLGKKGVGASSGDWRSENFEDRARNVAAAMDWLEARADIDATRLLVYGHSQGGYVIPLVSADPRVAGLVLSAASAEPVRDQIWSDQYEGYLRRGLSLADAAAKADSDQRWLDILLSGCGVVAYHYLCNVYRFDPAPHLAAITTPVLALFGENDPMVPPDKNLEKMRQLLGTDPRVQVVLLPKANHMFWRSETGAVDEYGDLLGPPARFPKVRAGDPDHERLARLGANRVEYADGFFDAVESFVHRHVAGSTVVE